LSEETLNVIEWVENTTGGTVSQIIDRFKLAKINRINVLSVVKFISENNQRE
jgi:hypothetical protein